MKSIMVLFSFFLIISCSSTIKSDSSGLRIRGLKNIKHNLEREKIDLFEAYIQSGRYMRKLDASSDEYTSTQTFMDELISGIDVKAREAFDNGEFEEAVRHALSLKTIDAPMGVSLKEVFDKYLSHALENNDPYTINNIKDEMAELKIIDKKEVTNVLNQYASIKSRGVFLHFYDKYNKLYPGLSDEYPILKEQFSQMNDLQDFDLKRVMDSVVTVILDKGLAMKNGMSYFDKSIGTGFFIDDKGHILTNHHVIADSVDPKNEQYAQVYVSTKDRPDDEIPAKVIGYDKVFDLALLEIPVKDNKPLVLGRSADMSIGDKIFTIGNPLGIKYTVTTGIISNMDLDFFQFGKGFMIDAAINPGNSGGPLIDERGQVIGIVFAGIPQFEGINFAIPFHWVRKTIPYLYQKGEVKRCWIGSGIYEYNKKIYFYYILPNGPASKAGILPNDRIVSIDGEPVESVEDAQAKIAWRRYPRLLKIITERKGVEKEHIVRLEERPYIPIKTAFERDKTSNLVTLIFGLQLEYYDKAILSKKYKIKKIYNGIYQSQVLFSEGDPITIYDLRYLEKEELIRLTVRFRQKDIGIIERIVTLASPGGINSIL